MFGVLKRTYASLFSIDKEEQTKTVFLGIMFFFIIFSYTITKDLKDSIFMAIMGSKLYVPFAKFVTLFALVPAIFLYSKLVDSVRRYQLLAYGTGIYGVLGLVFAFLLGTKVVGIAASVTWYKKFLGWLFYFYVETFTPFVKSVFWAFLNSVTSPEQAKKNYGILVSYSKIGGMASAGIGWALLSYGNFFKSVGFSDIGLLQLLLALSSCALLLVPLAITQMLKNVSQDDLHGYEAAYRLEEQQAQKGKEKTGIWSGLIMFFKYPYTMGIFGMVLFYEIMSAVLSYQRLGIAQDTCTTIAGVSCFLLGISFVVQFVGLLISLFGTRVLTTWLGERVALLMIPISMGTIIFYYVYHQTTAVLLICFVVSRAIYYSFNQPVMETLYIPTVKAVRFKSKSWIDSFGKKASKGVGALFNIILSLFGPVWIQIAQTGIFGVVILSWVGVAYFLGNRYHDAVKKGQVIGAEEYE